MRVGRWTAALLMACGLGGCGGAMPEAGAAGPRYAVADVATAGRRIEAILERVTPDRVYTIVDALKVRELTPGRLYGFEATYHIAGFLAPHTPRRYRVEGTYRLGDGEVTIARRRPL